jgi:hypothetical protein
VFGVQDMAWLGCRGHERGNAGGRGGSGSGKVDKMSLDVNAQPLVRGIIKDHQGVLINPKPDDSAIILANFCAKHGMDKSCTHVMSCLLLPLAFLPRGLHTRGAMIL